MKVIMGEGGESKLRGKEGLLNKTEANHNWEKRWKLCKGLCLGGSITLGWEGAIWKIYRPDESVWLHTDVFRELEVERKSQIREKQIGKVCLKPNIQRLEAGETSRALPQHGKGLRHKQKFGVAELHQLSSKTNAEVFNDSHKPFYQLLIKNHGLSFVLRFAFF